MARVLVVARMSFVFSMNGGACVRAWLSTSLYVRTGCVQVMFVSCGAIHRPITVSPVIATPSQGLLMPSSDVDRARRQGTRQACPRRIGSKYHRTWLQLQPPRA